jgi:predicted O-methyltransferase YrrM
MDGLSKYVESVISLVSNKEQFVEGFMIPKQSQQLIEFLEEHPEIETIAETGFNVGMSSAAMLSVRPNIKIWSFDLAEHNYVIKQKHLIDTLFPSRHTLLIGDTMQTLPNMNTLIKEPVFDFVFIDGGHVAPVPESDMRNLLTLLKSGGYMCIDDYNLQYGYYGVIQAVDALIEEKLLEKITVHEANDRSWVYCKKLKSTNP